jgi:hypothetical protein
MSNSCGQYGRNDQDEACLGNDRSMRCNVNLNATMNAVSLFKNGDLTPPAFQCRPKEHSDDFSGYWNSETDEIVIAPYANRYGRTDIEGCCWWGRGVLMTRGPCSFGRINGYMGVNAVSKGYVNFYDVDFCIYPEVVCDSPYSQDLRWAVGFFEWIYHVQQYNGTRSYLGELDNLVEDLIENRFINETNVEKFIDIVGWVLPMGCSQPDSRCDSTVDLQLFDERRDNFISLLNALALEEILPETTSTSTTDAAATTTTINDSHSNAESDGSVFQITNSSSPYNPEFWYPVSYTNNFEEGVCVRYTPIPPNVTTYQSELDCCIIFFDDQVKGKCLNTMEKTDATINEIPIGSLPRNPSKKPTPQPDPPSRRPTDEPTYEPTIGLILIPSSGFRRISTYASSCILLSALLELAMH